MALIFDFCAIRREREYAALVRERDTLRKTLRQPTATSPPYATLWRLHEIEKRLWILAHEMHADLTAQSVLNSGKLCVTALGTIETELREHDHGGPKFGPAVAKKAVATASAIYSDFMERMTALALGIVPATPTERDRISHLAKLSGEGYARILRGVSPPS
ncbi:MAG TPA: hypothetical protein VLB83_03345 [Candidatus Paceibacterota bacterium]|nr:hypothetical protein [Candidatus Paceibacterota bacterium]